MTYSRSVTESQNQPTIRKILPNGHRETMMTMNEENIEALRGFREDRGWTKAKMANRLSVPRMTYYRWENGRRKMPSCVGTLIMTMLELDLANATIDRLNVENQHLKEQLL